MNSDSKTVRGLSIAIVVLAALGILGVIAGFALIAIFGVAVNDPTVIAENQTAPPTAPATTSTTTTSIWEAWTAAASSRC